MRKLDSDKISIIICIIIVIGAIIFSVIYNKKEQEDNTIDNYQYLHNYEVNEVTYTYVTEQDMAKKYLADFVNLTINDKEAAYAKIDNYYKSQKLQTYTDFENALKNIYSTKFLSAKVVSYTVVDKTNYKLFYIIDGDNNTFIFKEKSIMNYFEEATLKIYKNDT